MWSDRREDGETDEEEEEGHRGPEVILARAVAAANPELSDEILEANRRKLIK
jgi:hypothetical protein